MSVVQARAPVRAWPFGFLLLSLSCFQFGAALAKPLFPLVGAQGASALRLGFAALVLAVLIRPWRLRFDRRTVGLILGYGLGLAGLNFFFFMAIRTIPLGLTVAIEFTGPLLLATMASRRPIDLVWAALAATGIVLLLPVAGLSQRLDPVGLGFAFASATCWAAYILFGQRAAAVVPAPTATALGVVVAALVVLPVGIAHAGAALLRWDVLPLGFAVAMISGSLPYVLEMTALKHLPTRVFGIMMSLEPAFGALFGFLLLGQRLSPTQGLAILAVMTASAGVALSHTPAEAPA